MPECDEEFPKNQLFVIPKVKITRSNSKDYFYNENSDDSIINNNKNNIMSTSSNGTTIEINKDLVTRSNSNNRRKLSKSNSNNNNNNINTNTNICITDNNNSHIDKTSCIENISYNNKNNTSSIFKQTVNTTKLRSRYCYCVPNKSYTNHRSSVSNLLDHSCNCINNNNKGDFSTSVSTKSNRKYQSSMKGLYTGYEQYQSSLLSVPLIAEYGDASSDDLSSEWDSDAPDIVSSPPRSTHHKPSGWRKLRNIVQWTPFFQTYKKQRYPWVQLAGHQGNFKAGPDQGTILKKLCPKEEKCFKVLMKDVLRPYVPEYKGQITSDDGECTYLQLQDLLGDFSSPCVMDCKIGVRTYLEEELAKAKENPKLRKDMYEKMIQIDPGAPTEEEHRLKGITKPRYMVWRETISSTACLGFRIEGIKKADGTSSKDFKTTKTKEQIIEAFKDFTNNFPHAIPKYIQRLKAIKATLDTSEFFQTHEVIGSSLLFVHDRCNANIWLIDFAKSLRLPDDTVIDHNSKWTIGSHEDGYLIGINNLISIFVTMLEQQPVVITPPPPDMIQTNQKSEDEKTNY